jgi:hypothetical protein
VCVCVRESVCVYVCAWGNVCVGVFCVCASERVRVCVCVGVCVWVCGCVGVCIGCAEKRPPPGDTCYEPRQFQHGLVAAAI